MTMDARSRRGERERKEVGCVWEGGWVSARDLVHQQFPGANLFWILIHTRWIVIHTEICEHSREWTSQVSAGHLAYVGKF